MKRHRLQKDAYVTLAKLWLAYSKPKAVEVPKKVEEKPVLEAPLLFNNVTMRKKKESQKEPKKEEPDMKNVTMRRRKPPAVAAHWEEMTREPKEEQPEPGRMDRAEETLLYIKRKEKDNRYQMDLLWKDINFLGTQRTRRRAGDPAALKNVRVALMIQELNGKLKMKTPADKEDD